MGLGKEEVADREGGRKVLLIELTSIPSAIASIAGPCGDAQREEQPIGSAHESREYRGETQHISSQEGREDLTVHASPVSR